MGPLLALFLALTPGGRALALGAGDLVVAEGGSRLVVGVREDTGRQKVLADGTLLAGGRAITITPDGRVFATDSVLVPTESTDPNDAFLASIIEIGPEPGVARVISEQGLLRRPTAIVYDPLTEDLMVADALSGSIIQVHLDPEKEGKQRRYTKKGIFSGPNGMTVFGECSDFYISEGTGDKILKIPRSETDQECLEPKRTCIKAKCEVETLTERLFLSRPSELVVAPDGEIFIADALNSAVIAVDLDRGSNTVQRAVAVLQNLLSPRGIAIDGNGELYVADRRNGRIVRIDRVSGAQTTILNADGLAGWLSIEVDADGDLRILDIERRRIESIDLLAGSQELLASGDLLGDAGNTALAPIDVDATEEGDAIVLTAGGGLVRIDVGDGSMTELAPAGSFPNGAGIAIGLVQTEEFAFVSDGGASEVDCDTPAVGVPASIRQVDLTTGAITEVTAGDLLVDPRGLDADATGKLFVVDSLCGIVVRVDPVTGAQSVVDAEEGEQSLGDPLEAPTDIAVRSDNLLVVIDPPRNAVVEVELDTGDRRIVAEDYLLEELSAVSMGPGSFPYISGGPTGRVVRVAPGNGNRFIVSQERDLEGVAGLGFFDGSLLAVSATLNNLVRVEVLGTSVGPLFAAGTLERPQRVTADFDGTVVVADAAASAIVRIDPATLKRSLVSQGGFLRNPEDVAIDADGDYWVVDSVNRSVVEIDRENGTQTVRYSGEPLSLPVAIEVSIDEQIVIVDRIRDGIYLMDPAGGPLTFLSQGRLIKDPQDIAQDLNGDFLIAPGVERKVVHVDRKTGAQHSVGKVGKGLIVAAIEVGPAGDVYLTEVVGQRVVRLDLLSGKLRTLSKKKKLQLPTGIAVLRPNPDRDGCLPIPPADPDAPPDDDAEDPPSICDGSWSLVGSESARLKGVSTQRRDVAWDLSIVDGQWSLGPASGPFLSGPYRANEKDGSELELWLDEPSRVRLTEKLKADYDAALGGQALTLTLIHTRMKARGSAAAGYTIGGKLNLEGRSTAFNGRQPLTYRFHVDVPEVDVPEGELP